MELNNYLTTSMQLKTYYLLRILQSAQAHQFFFPKGVHYYGRGLWEEDVKSMLRFIKPMKAVGENKVRMGWDKDGGYVMLDPGSPADGGIVYSFGVSSYDPWSSDMAHRGFSVYQYDGTIESPPETGHNMYFFKYNITGDIVPQPGHKNIKTIFSDLGHDKNNDIILNVDIEGAEWDFFKNISTLEILKFRQIIVEFHKCMIFNIDD
ncbi:MAG: FkbM family methyltransferase, partial [Holosporales bacterium]|nr:FkbM family methyltransferase [Holosporales bacterium]